MRSKLALNTRDRIARRWHSNQEGAEFEQSTLERETKQVRELESQHGWKSAFVQSLPLILVTT